MSEHICLTPAVQEIIFKISNTCTLSGAIFHN